MPTTEFFRAIEQINDVANDANTPDNMRTLADATRDALTALAQRAQEPAQTQQPSTEQRGLIEALPPPPPLTNSIPPGTYEPARNDDGTVQQAGSPISSTYERARNEDGTVATE